jgi:hypothetical protein
MAEVHEIQVFFHDLFPFLLSLRSLAGAPLSKRWCTSFIAVCVLDHMVWIVWSGNVAFGAVCCTSQARVELIDVKCVQAELSELQSTIWENHEVTEEERDLLEHKAELLKIKMAAAESKITHMGMRTGLMKVESFQRHVRRVEQRDDDTDVAAKEHAMLIKLVPFAFLYMMCVFSASMIQIDDSKPIPGNLFSIVPYHPVVWPLANADSRVEVRIQIQSSSSPGTSHVALADYSDRRRIGGSTGSIGGSTSTSIGSSSYTPSFLHNNHKWNKALRHGTRASTKLLGEAKHGRNHGVTIMREPAPPRTAGGGAASPPPRPLTVPARSLTLAPSLPRRPLAAPPLPAVGTVGVSRLASSRKLLDQGTGVIPRPPCVEAPWEPMWDDLSQEYFCWDTLRQESSWNCPVVPCPPQSVTPLPSTPKPAEPPSPRSSVYLLY